MDQSKQYIIALDQSTSNTGCAIYKNNKLIISYVISPESSQYSIRINKLYKSLKELLLSKTFQGIDKKQILLAIEDIQLQDKEPNGGKSSSYLGVLTYKKLAQLQGVIINLCISEGIEYVLVSPSRWKKFCGIKGKYRDEQKKNAMLFAENITPKKITQDEADAICIGYYIASMQNKTGEVLY